MLSVLVLAFVGFIHSFLYIQTMESFSLDSSIDPELQDVMADLLESVYGEDFLSQQSQLSIVAPASDEDESDDEASSCDPSPTLLAREFIEANNCEEEKEGDVSGEGEGEEPEIPERCGCTKRCFALFENKKDIITEYRRNLAEFTKDEKDILLLSKLEQMEHSGEETRQGKRTCQRFNYTFQGNQICESAWRFIHDIGELIARLYCIEVYFSLSNEKEVRIYQFLYHLMSN